MLIKIYPKMFEGFEFTLKLTPLTIYTLLNNVKFESGIMYSKKVMEFFPKSKKCREN